MSACAISISNQNAFRHGGTCKSLIIRGENRADFDALLQGLFDEFQPDTEQSRLFVENVAEAHWLLARRQRAHHAIEAAIFADEPDPADWTEAHLKRLALADRYKTQAERALKRALNNLEGWRKWHRSEEQRETREAQWSASHALRERRVALQEQKLSASRTRSETVTPRLVKDAVSSPLPSQPLENSATTEAIGVCESDTSLMPTSRC